MSFYVDAAGSYYEGDRQSPDDVQVEKRPSAHHVWQGGAWVLGPARARKLVPLDFLDLFTEAEQLSVAQAAMASALVKLWYDRTLAATYITREDPRVEAGLQALVDAGLLTEQRKAAVLAAMLEAE